MAERADQSWRNTPKWRQLRRNALSGAKFQCQNCGELHSEDAPLDVHHIVPVAKGGAWDNPNILIVLCRRCHLVAEGKTPRRSTYQRPPHRGERVSPEPQDQEDQKDQEDPGCGTITCGIMLLVVIGFAFVQCVGALLGG